MDDIVSRVNFNEDAIIPAAEYCISFDTRIKPGKLEAVRVRIDVIEVNPEDTVRIDLAAHPLYSNLVDYVKLNPGRR